MAMAAFKKYSYRVQRNGCTCRDSPGTSPSSERKEFAPWGSKFQGANSLLFKITSTFLVIFNAKCKVNFCISRKVWKIVKCGEKIRERAGNFVVSQRDLEKRKGKSQGL